MKRIHYCKSLKNTGKPIMVNDIDSGKVTTVKKVSGYGHWEIEYNNAKGSEKRSGASTILKVWK